MRHEATLKQWKDLYEVGDNLKQQKPWDTVPFDAIFGVQRSCDPEDTIYMSIHCEEGKRGLSVYKGYRGLISMMMLYVGDLLRADFEYIAHSQNSLNVEWGTQDILNEDQTEVMKKLGICYCGDEYQGFIRYEQGYCPDVFEQDDVLLMTESLKDYLDILTYFTKHKDEVEFLDGVMILKKYGKNCEDYTFETVQIPFDGCFCEDNGVRDAAVIEKLKKCHRNIHTYRVNAHPLDIRIPLGDRDGFPMVVSILDVSEETILSMKIVEPDKDENREILNWTIEAILENGVPNLIYGDNVVICEAVQNLCEICDIRLGLTPIEEEESIDPTKLN